MFDDEGMVVLVVVVFVVPFSMHIFICLVTKFQHYKVWIEGLRSLITRINLESLGCIE